uniref:Metalloprotease family M01 putative n=1 Tax=Albugo laibachii Nc14 TaxID=890382 RepID=F0W5N0_9STRA|nr:metalloprotease family M01 putative [Albugo laibachii Nc14]|eukprot:CCA16421.1 metalloprotease family M01 putative [Albugo laibachii Nc14]
MSDTKELKRYRFTHKDFNPLETKPLHLDLVFDIEPEKISVVSTTTFQHLGENALHEFRLNSKELQIVQVERITASKATHTCNDFEEHVASFRLPVALKYQVDAENHFLVVRFETPIQKEEEFVLKFHTVVTPSENILEGLYYDYTPAGAPKTIITQCQQHGFQRITPCVDTMDAKAYYTTTIIADKKYTNMITNGDLAPQFYDGNNEPVYHSTESVLGEVDDRRHVLKYHNHKVKMAPYLFFLGVGMYETYRRELEFPDGDTTLLEILAFPGFFKPDEAKQAVKMLHDSVLWTMISLGPEACQHHVERKRVYELIEQRESLKAKMSTLCVGPNEKKGVKTLSDQDTQRLEGIRAELKNLIKVWNKTGYKYTGAVYREIAMENSYYGGMENVGNTTIVSSCLCPSERMDDKSYMYMERVKVHEYYHNINGSQVTGQSPFEIWLNEAVTVHMERKRCAAIFGSDYSRLNDVLYMFAPIGPLAEDKSATSLSIEPEGFNQTQELVSAVTYSKAPEFVRMVELIIGEDQFHKALDVYHTRYSFGNATTLNWINCMEEVSKCSLKDLARTWLKRPGHPHVTYSTSYESTTCEYKVWMKQTGFENMPSDNAGPWVIPVDYALIKGGKVMKEGLFTFSEKEFSYVIKDVKEKPDFFSFARGWSFFGTSKSEDNSIDVLVKQTKSDPDSVNRYQGYRMVADLEKAKIINGLLSGDMNVTISSDFVDLHASILFSEDITPAARALTLSEKDTVPTKDDLSHHYREIHKATRALLQAVWVKYASQIEQMFTKLCEGAQPGPHYDQFQERALKQHLLALMDAGGKPCVLPNTTSVKPTTNPTLLARNLLETSTFASDKVTGFSIIMNDEEYPERSQVQERVFEEWRQTPDTLTKYIGVISCLHTSDVGKQILKLIAHSSFNMAQSSHSRTLARGLSLIRDFSLATDGGLQVLSECFTKIGKVNQMSAYPILQCFDHLERFDQETRTKMLQILQKMQESIDPKKEESLYNRLNIILKKA